MGHFLSSKSPKIGNFECGLEGEVVVYTEAGHVFSRCVTTQSSPLKNAELNVSSDHQTDETEIQSGSAVRQPNGHQMTKPRPYLSFVSQC